MKQYYKVLGLPTNATLDEVKNARNSLLKKYHPDCYKGSISFAEEKTREINDAFSKLSAYLKEQEKQDRQVLREKIEKQKQKRQAKVFETKVEKSSKPAEEIRKQPKKEKVVREKPAKETEEIVEFEDSEYISEKTKKRKYINGTIIQDERKSEEAGKRFLDFMIYGSFLLLIVLVVLFITGVI